MPRPSSPRARTRPPSTTPPPAGKKFVRTFLRHPPSVEDFSDEKSLPRLSGSAAA
ncbi:hypothetical protein Ga0080559_TMP1720 [Salipiger profundus]|uniref:Uncharacterized protein n=1 Tax=Salipiger profundus TaxID=1229727 RepID=A0A1U7D364_9RHOB|nr:hypothetical protein Ga0080559_TMP1720 [Salipiger profundus]